MNVDADDYFYRVSETHVVYVLLVYGKKKMIVEEAVRELCMVKNEGMNPSSRRENPRTIETFILLRHKNLM